MANLVQYFDLPEAAIASQPFTAGALYVANDTGRIFFDSINVNARIDVANSILLITTESARSALLAPISGKLYCVLESGRMYLYADGTWYAFGTRPQIHFENIVVEKNTPLVLSDSRIIASDNAVFIPDLSVADLVTGSSCTCAAGSVTVNITADYNIIGRVIVN